MSVLRTELRQARPAAAVFAVVTAVLMWTHPADWGGRWDFLGEFLRISVIVLGPLAVVLGTWWGGRDRRDGVDELLASTCRSRMAHHAVTVAALTLASYAGTLLGVACAAWTIVLIGGYGTVVAPLQVLSVLPTLFGYAAVGFALGRWVPWRIAAPIAGIVTYLVLGFGIYDEDGLAVAVGMGRVGGTGLAAFDARGLVLSALAAVGAGLALTGLASGERRPGAARAWMAVGVVGVVAAVALGAVTSATAYAGRAETPQARHVPRVCTHDDGPRVCVLAEDQHQLARATRQARAVIARFGGVDGAPTSAGVDGWGGPVARDRWSVLPLDSTGTGAFGGVGGHYTTYLPGVGYYLDPARYCRTDDYGVLPDDPTGDVRPRVDLASTWLSGQPFYLDGDQFPLAQRFEEADDATRRAYVARLLAAVRSCEADAVRAADEVLER